MTDSSKSNEKPAIDSTHRGGPAGVTDIGIISSSSNARPPVPKLRKTRQAEPEVAKHEAAQDAGLVKPEEVQPEIYRDPRLKELGFILDERHRVLVVSKEAGKPVAVPANSKIGRGLVRKSMNRDGATLIKRVEINEVIEGIEEILDASDLTQVVPYRIARVCDHDIVIDAGDRKGTRYHITDQGVFENTKEADAVIFARSPNAEVIKCAEKGRVDLLEKYLNVGEQQLWLLIAWLAYTIATPKLQGTKFVHLVLSGSEGSGKSFTSTVLASLIDSQSVKASAFPSDKKSLAIALSQSHISVFDNMRTINAQSSDLLAQTSSRATTVDRRLYTDGEQHLMILHSACIMNGIYEISKYPDFIQRALVIQMTPLSKGGYTSEASLQECFEQDRPAIQRGLYDLIANVLAKLNTVKLKVNSRMVDWYRFLTAMDQVVNLDFELAEAYENMVEAAQLDNLQNDTLTAAIIEWGCKESEASWTGTAAELLRKLERTSVVGEGYTRDFPKNPVQLGRRLAGIQASLEQQGISITRSRGKLRKVTIIFSDEFMKSARDEMSHADDHLY